LKGTDNFVIITKRSGHNEPKESRSLVAPGHSCPPRRRHRKFKFWCHPWRIWT